MVGYVLGEDGENRAEFVAKASAEAVYADNSEVIGLARAGNVLYVAKGKRPFGNMTVDEYVSYSRALSDGVCGKNPNVDACLKQVKLRGNPRKKLARLSVFDYRKAEIAGKLTDRTKTIYANFAGLRYSRRNRQALMSFASDFSSYEVVLLVSDARLLCGKTDAPCVMKIQDVSFSCSLLSVKKVSESKLISLKNKGFAKKKTIAI